MPARLLRQLRLQRSKLCYIEFKHEETRPKHQLASGLLQSSCLPRCTHSASVPICKVQGASFSAALFCPPPHSMHSSLRSRTFIWVCMLRSRSTDIHDSTDACCSRLDLGIFKLTFLHSACHPRDHAITASRHEPSATGFKCCIRAH